MAFEGLSEKLAASFKKLRNRGKLTEADVKDAMREVRLALLEADVNYKVAKEFTAKVTARAVGEEVMESQREAYSSVFGQVRNSGFLAASISWKAAR